MTSIFDDRFQALGEPWARDADTRLAVRARAQRQLAERAVAAAGCPDTEATVRRLLKAGFGPEGEAAFLRAVADETGADPDDLARRLEEHAHEVAAQAEADCRAH